MKPNFHVWMPIRKSWFNCFTDCIEITMLHLFKPVSKKPKKQNFLNWRISGFRVGQGKYQNKQISSFLLKKRIKVDIDISVHREYSAEIDFQQNQRRVIYTNMCWNFLSKYLLGETEKYWFLHQRQEKA